MSRDKDKGMHLIKRNVPLIKTALTFATNGPHHSYCNCKQTKVHNFLISPVQFKDVETFWTTEKIFLWCMTYSEALASSYLNYLKVTRLSL